MARDTGVDPTSLENMDYEDLLVKRLIQKACAGDEKSMRELLDRHLGKPKQVTENVNVEVTYTDFLEQCLIEDAQSEEVPRITDTNSDPVEDLLS